MPPSCRATHSPFDPPHQGEIFLTHPAPGLPPWPPPLTCALVNSKREIPSPLPPSSNLSATPLPTQFLSRYQQGFSQPGRKAELPKKGQDPSKLEGRAWRCGRVLGVVISWLISSPLLW